MRINEIFNSIDGEVNHWGQGKLTTFIRVAGCNLRCTDCDTSYTFYKGVEMTTDEIVQRVKELGGDKITITGGEPLQNTMILRILVTKLRLRTKKISIETNGTFPIIKDLPVNWIMDFKTLSTGQHSRMERSRFSQLCTTDWIKFVIFDKRDYNQSINDLYRLKISGCKAKIAFSPAIGHLEPAKLMEWLQADGAWDITLNIQIHKIFGIK